MKRYLALAVLAILPATATTVFGPNPNSSTYLAPGGTITTGGVNLDGVVRVIIGSTGCSGALLANGYQIVTAAHCVDQGAQAGDVSVHFDTAGGSYSLGVTAIHLNPGWTADPLGGTDIAVLTLAAPATGVTGYFLYTGSLELGQEIEIAGYGYSGVGIENPGAYPYGVRRYGLNQYDATGTIFVGGTADVLMGDFDDLTAAHDAFGTISPSLADLGYGEREVSVAPGDSGGASFLNGFLVGVHSFGSRLDLPGLPDIDGEINASFGEFFGDTRVSSHASWIESLSTPEPGSFALLALGLAGLAFRSNRLRARR